MTYPRAFGSPMIELVIVREKGVLYEDQIGTVA